MRDPLETDRVSHALTTGQSFHWANGNATRFHSDIAEDHILKQVKPAIRQIPVVSAIMDKSAQTKAAAIMSLIIFMVTP